MYTFSEVRGETFLVGGYGWAGVGCSLRAGEGGGMVGAGRLLIQEHIPVFSLCWLQMCVLCAQRALYARRTSAPHIPLTYAAVQFAKSRHFC